MQNNELMDLVEQINGEFKEMIGNVFVRVDTGEIFTKPEVEKYIKKKIELFTSKQVNSIKQASQDIFGVKSDQRLINKKNKKPKSNGKSKFDNGDFNIVYKNETILMELIKLKLEVNEKLVYYVLRDFIAYPSNCILINGEVPQMIDLEPLIGLKERTIRKALKGLEGKGVVKLLRSGVRKAIYFNPYYYASGKDLDINTLKMFELIECDDDKIEQYINDSKEKLN